MDYIHDGGSLLRAVALQVFCHVLLRQVKQAGTIEIASHELRCE